MSFKRKFISAITSVFAIFTFAAFVSAQNDSTNNQQNQTQEKQNKFERRGKFGKRGDKFGKGMHKGGAMRELSQVNLTDAQKEQIRAILESSRVNQTSFQEMREIMQAKRDGTITDAQKERMQALRRQLKQNAEITNQQILAVLTAEQRAQLEQIKAERKQKWEQRRQEKLNRRNRQTPPTENN